MQKIHLFFVLPLLLLLFSCAGADIKNISSVPGQVAHDFTLPDQEGKFWKLSEVAKNHRAVVLAFYPKDDTRE